MKRPHGLTAEEAALWRKLTSNVKPLVPPPNGEGGQPQAGGGARAGSPDAAAARQSGSAPAPSIDPARAPPPPLRGGPPPRSGEASRTLDRHGLDAGWERKLARGLVDPDFTLDLHGASLDAAHGRLANGLGQAKAMGARVVLLIAGRPRPVEAADRGHARGAIRAKVLDWIAAGDHASDVAAIRGAHRRHGGAGALYIVLRRRR